MNILLIKHKVKYGKKSLSKLEKFRQIIIKCYNSLPEFEKMHAYNCFVCFIMQTNISIIKDD